MEKGKPKYKASVEFYAPRGEDGKYLGCMEFAQGVQAIREPQG